MDGGSSTSTNTSAEQMTAEMPVKATASASVAVAASAASAALAVAASASAALASLPISLPMVAVSASAALGATAVAHVLLTSKRKEQSKKVNEEAERIKCEKDKLSKKPDTDPQVAEAAECLEKMTEEILDQKLRLTQNRCEVTGKGKMKKTRNGQHLNNGITDMEPRPWDDNETDNASLKPPLFDTAQLDVPGEEMSVHNTGMAECKSTTSSGDLSEMKRHIYMIQKCQNVRLQEAVETSLHDTEVARCKVTTSSSIREVCSDVKMYLKQVTELVQQKIQSLPQYVRDKLETLINSFQRLIAGMWKLLLLELLCHELASLLTFFPNEHANISKKKGRLKYGFEMAAMLVLWLSHDVESNPGPQFSVRWCLERITRTLSEVLKKELPVEGSLWSKPVAEAAYAAGYSPDCQWTNPSGNSKDKLTPLIERATELGRVLTEMGCLPQEFVPFVNDLGNYKVQEVLVVHYKVEHYKAAVDILLGISSFSKAHKQDVIQKTETLKEKFLNYADFGILADTSGTQSVAIKMQSKKRRGAKRKRNRNRNQVKELQNSDMSTLTASNASCQPACKPMPDISDMLLNEIDDDFLKWLDNKEGCESGNVSTKVVTSPGADLSHAVDPQTQSHACDPVPAHEEKQSWQNEPYTDGDDSRVTVGNNSVDVLCSDTLTQSPDMPLSLSDTQTWTAETGQINHSEQSQMTGDTTKNFHPKSTEQGIMQLLDLLPNQDSPASPAIQSGTDTSVTMKESTTRSVMETSLSQTSATKQSTPECDIEVDVRRDCDLYPLGNHSTTETENVAFEELETVTTHIPLTSTDQEREITLDDHETTNTTGNRVTQGRDRCISTLCDDHDRHADTLVGTYSDGDRSNTRDTDVEFQQENSETTPDKQDNINCSYENLPLVRQERSPEESHSTKQDSHQGEDNSNETTTKDAKVTFMTPSCTREPTRVEDRQFEAFKLSVLKDMESRWEAFKAAQETHTPNGHVESNSEHGQAESPAQNRKRKLRQTKYQVKRRK